MVSEEEGLAIFLGLLCGAFLVALSLVVWRIRDAWRG